MTNKELLISRINSLPEAYILSLLDAVTLMEGKTIPATKPDCPYCGSHGIIRYGHKRGKQRYIFYRGVTTKYIDRYNALFGAAYHNAENIISCLTDTVLAVTAPITIIPTGIYWNWAYWCYNHYRPIC